MYTKSRKYSRSRHLPVAKHKNNVSFRDFFFHAVFRVVKAQYDLLRFDFQVGTGRLECSPGRRRLLLLPACLWEAAGVGSARGAERGARGVRLPVRAGTRLR